MAPKTPDENGQFLLLCAVYSNQIDFEAVGGACGLNKTQAYKRFWSIKKNFENAKGQGPLAARNKDDEADGPKDVAAASVKKRKGRPPGSGVGGKGKKRKVNREEESSGGAEEANDGVEDNDCNADDDEGDAV